MYVMVFYLVKICPLMNLIGVHTIASTALTHVKTLLSWARMDCFAKKATLKVRLNTLAQPSNIN